MQQLYQMQHLGRASKRPFLNRVHLREKMRVENLDPIAKSFACKRILYSAGCRGDMVGYLEMVILCVYVFCVEDLLRGTFGVKITVKVIDLFCWQQISVHNAAYQKMRPVDIRSFRSLEAYVTPWETARVVSLRLCVALMGRSNMVDGDVSVETCKASIRCRVGTC